MSKPTLLLIHNNIVYRYVDGKREVALVRIDPESVTSRKNLEDQLEHYRVNGLEE